MIRAPDLEWIAQLCRLHRPPLVPAAWYPPSGSPDNEHVDAVVETEDHRSRIAVEVTRCYRGDRASGEAKIEEQFLERLCSWLRNVAISCLGARGYRVTFTVYFPATLTTLVPRIKDFLRAPEDQEASQTPIERALGNAEREGHAAMIGKAGMDSNTLFRWTSQVYVEHIAPTDSTEVHYKLEEPAPSGREQWQTVIPKTFWTDVQAIIDAIADKRSRLPRYRQLAAASNASALWLLLVVEESSAWDILGALRGDRHNELEAALAEQPQFDQVYLLARGPWLPDGWDLKRDGLHYEGGPIWKLKRIWPAPATTATDPGALGHL